MFTTMKSGPEQLRAWIERTRFNQRTAAAHLGFDETYVSQILGGKRTPGLDNALVLERKTGIPVEAWASDILDKIEAPVGADSSKSLHDKA